MSKRPAAFVARPLTPDRWSELVAFFGTSGAYANCWCTWWRQTSGQFDAGCRDQGAGNRDLLQRITADGKVPGLIGYRGDEPVGWVSVAPRAEFGRVLRSPNLRPDRDPDPDPDPDPDEHGGRVWSIVCFWIPRQHRRSGVGTALLDAAVRHAGAAGSAIVEAYPIDTKGERTAAAEVFTGTLAMFERAGFAEVRRRAPKRPVVQRRV